MLQPWRDAYSRCARSSPQPELASEEFGPSFGEVQGVMPNASGMISIIACLGILEAFRKAAGTSQTYNIQDCCIFSPNSTKFNSFLHLAEYLPGLILRVVEVSSGLTVPLARGPLSACLHFINHEAAPNIIGGISESFEGFRMDELPPPCHDMTTIRPLQVPNIVYIVCMILVFDDSKPSNRVVLEPCPLDLAAPNIERDHTTVLPAQISLAAEASWIMTRDHSPGDVHA
jgi:hypothetical protein